MADRYERILAVLAKIETTEGTDATPTGGANAMQMTNVRISPLAGEEVSRDLLLPYLGHQGVILTGNYVTIEGEVELAGSGEAGTAPAYGPLLRACGMAQTIDAGVSVEYAPVSGAFESATVYWVQSGVRHIALGVRGNVSLSLVPKQIPRLKFNLMGLLGTISDQAMPTVDLSGFVVPLAVSKANTTLDLHGYDIAESVEIDLGQSVAARFLIGEEGIRIGNRQATGTAVVKAETLATVDWFALALAGTRDTMQVVHGVTAGNIVTIDAPQVQIGRPSQGATDGILNYSLPLMLTPDAGNDELVLTFT